MIRWLKPALLAAVGILVGMFYWSNLAWAQTPTPTITPSAVVTPTEDVTATPVANSTQETKGRPQPRAQGKMQPFRQDERQAILAQALGMEPADLQQALTAGKRFPQLLKERGLTPQAFQRALQKAFADHLKQAVADGRIPQQQADQWSQRLQRGAFGGPRWRMDQRQPDGNQPGLHRWDGPHGPGGFRGWLWQMGHRLGWRWLVWLSQAGPMPGNMPRWR